MNRRHYSENYKSSNRNSNDRDSYKYSFSNKTNTMNNNPVPPFTGTSNLNPAASPFKATNTSNYFNLTNISKTRTEYVKSSIQKFNSQNSDTDRRSNHYHSSSEQLSHKKHKKDPILQALEDQRDKLRGDLDYYTRKRKRLLDDLKNCDESIEVAVKKLKSCDEKILQETKRLENESSNNVDNFSTSAINNINQLNRSMNLNQINSPANVKLTPNQTNTNIQTPNQTNANIQTTVSSLSPVLNSGVNSINNLSINNGKKEQVANAQSSINNVISNLLNKKRDVEFLDFDYIFEKKEEIYEPKLIDGNAVVKFETNLKLKKILTTEDKKNGLRFIIRGCIYDDKSTKQEDNLSFVKSYEFQTTTKKHTYENNQSAASKLLFPFDFSDYCRFDNKLGLTINLNKKLLENKKIAFGIYHVKRLDYDTTLKKVQKDEVIRKKKSEITKSQVANSFGQSGGVIQMETLKIALVDPQSKAKISMPCIGENCEHIACFDGLTFLESNSKKFSWYCPICGKPIGYNQLFYDEYYFVSCYLHFRRKKLINEILRKVSMDCTAIEFDKMSNWIPLSEEGKKNQEEESEDCITLD